MPESLSEDYKLVLEQFVVILYDRSSTEKQVNEARLDMFARKQKSYEMIPPSQSALIEHTKRAAYQAGHIWGQTLILSHLFLLLLSDAGEKMFYRFGNLTGQLYQQ